MIYGTHNSLSYAKPTKWWMKLINFTSKCQDLTVEQQWNYGVRYYDIRLKDDYFHTYHGAIEYDVYICDILDYLNKKAGESKEKCYVALNYEGDIKDYEEIKLNRFRLEIQWNKDTYRNLTFCGGYCKNPWRKVLPEIENPDINELYWEFMNWDRSTLTKTQKIKRFFKNLLHFSPKYWAKRDNKIHKEIAKNNELDIVVLDFVEFE